MGNSKKIGVATATIVGMNAMIGSGIFTAPASLASNVGPAGILAYLFVIPAVWLMALSIARLAQLFPEEGSFYTYARQWGGHYIGLIAIISYFIGLLVAMGLLAQMAGQSLHDLFPAFSAQTLGLVALSSLIILNMFGVVLSQLGQHILIICTTFPLIATTIICFLHANPSYLFPFAPYGYLNIFKATRIVIFGFFGFECATSLFNIVHKPHVNVPRALTYSIIIVGTIYTLFVFSLILAVPLNLFSNGKSVMLSKILATVFPNNPLLIFIISISILSAILGTVHSMIWSSSHLFLLIFKKLTHISTTIGYNIVNEKTSVLIVGLCIFSSYMILQNQDLFFNITAISIVTAYVLSMITLLTIKQEWKSGQNIKTIFGLATAFVIFAFAVEGLISSLS